MKYNVETIRAAGLEAKWTKTSKGAPIIAARDLDSGNPNWYAIDDAMWDQAKKDGILTAFQDHTVLGEFFSLPI